MKVRALLNLHLFFDKSDDTKVLALVEAIQSKGYDPTLVWNDKEIQVTVEYKDDNYFQTDIGTLFELWYDKGF